MCCHSLFFSSIGVMGNMFLFMARYSGCGHFGCNMRGALKRNGSITGPVLICPAASGLAFSRPEAFALCISRCRCSIKTLHLASCFETLQGRVKEVRPSVDAIHHAYLSAK
jgi:hypothetical protein